VTASYSSIDNPYTFTGRRLDEETGLMYYYARYYSPTLGRFIGRDPLEYVDGKNLYEYVGGATVNALDPLGFGQVLWDGTRVNRDGTLDTSTTETRMGDLGETKARYERANNVIEFLNEHPPGPPVGPLVVEDIGPSSALDHWRNGTGQTVEIIGQDFINHVKNIDKVKFDIDNLETRMRFEMKRKAKSVGCGEAVSADAVAKGKSFTMTGWRWAAFGTAYHDYSGKCVGKKKCLDTPVDGYCVVIEYDCMYTELVP
jgi:RHS repeat-associated protein